MKQLVNPAASIVLGPWVDGLREVDNPYEILPTEFISSKRFDWFNGYLVKHPGLAIMNYDQQLGGSGEIDFVFRYNLEPESGYGINSNGKELLLAVDDTLYAYKESNRTPTAAAGAVTFNNVRFSAIPWHDGSGPALIMVNGEDGVCKYVMNSTPGSVGTATAGISAADGYLITLFKERAWIWNLTHSVSAGAWRHTNWGMFSARGDMTTFNDADIVEVGADDEDIKAVIVLEESQVVITDKSIHHVFGSSFETITVRGVPAPGTIDGASVTFVDKPVKMIGYLALGGYHVYLPDTGQVFNISQGLTKSFLDWTTGQRYTAVYDHQRRAIRIMHNTTPVKNRSLFATGLRTNQHNEQVAGAWTQFELPINVLSAVEYMAGGDAQKVVVGSDDGYLYELDGGDYDDELSDGAGGTELNAILSQADLGVTWCRDEHALVKKQINWLTAAAFGSGTVNISIADNKGRYLKSVSMVLPAAVNPIWNTVTWAEFVWGGTQATTMVRKGFKALPPAQGFRTVISHTDSFPLILGLHAIHYTPLALEAGV